MIHDQDQRGPVQRDGALPAQHFAELALRGSALLFDLQAEAMRNVWQAQARSAALLGVPDVSPWFATQDERARRLFSTAAEQAASTLRVAVQTATTLQREMQRLVEQQAVTATEQMRRQVEDLGREALRGLEELQGFASRQAGAFARDTEAPRRAEERTPSIVMAGEGGGDARATAEVGPRGDKVRRNA